MTKKQHDIAASKRRRKTHWCASKPGVHRKRPCLAKFPKT